MLVNETTLLIRLFLQQLRLPVPQTKLLLLSAMTVSYGSIWSASGQRKHMLFKRNMHIPYEAAFL